MASGTDGNLKKKLHFKVWMNNDHSLKLGFIQTIYDIHKNYSSSSGEAFLKKDYKRYFKSFLHYCHICPHSVFMETMLCM